jgi:hypothetical protein
METLVRGYINGFHSQRSFYFEGTDSNIANFIIEYSALDNEIEIDTIFGKTILTYKLSEDKVCGKERYIAGIEACLLELKSGTVVRSKVDVLDLEDLNNVDEFDNIEVREKEFEKYI